MANYAVCCLVLVFLAHSIDSVKAAEFRTNMAAGVVELRGPIRKGDALQLERLLEKLAPVKPDGSGRWKVSLESNGGEFREGLKLAHLLNSRAIGAVVPDGRSCLSACAVAFLGGTSPDPSDESLRIPARSMGANSRLGFHAPFVNAEMDQRFSAQQAEEIFNQAVRTMVMVAADAHIMHLNAGTVAELMIPQRLETRETSTVGDIGRLGIALRNVERPPRVTERMVAHFCLNALWWPQEVSSESFTWMLPSPEDLRVEAIKIKTDDGRIVNRRIVTFFSWGEGGLDCFVEKVDTNAGSRIDCEGMSSGFWTGEQKTAELPRFEFDCYDYALDDPERPGYYDETEHPWFFLSPSTSLTDVSEELVRLSREGKPLE